GRRFAGPRGSLAAFAGLILMPMVIILALGVLYRVAGQVPQVKGAFSGVACAAAGLVVAMAVRMGRALRGSAWQIAVAVVALAAGVGPARHGTGRAVARVAREDALMDAGVLVELARQFLLLSLLSIGGVSALIPEIHRQV